MQYVSTRGAAPVLGFEDVVLAGLARDGGLYVPQTWPLLSHQEWQALRGLSYPALAARLIAPFVGDAFTEVELRGLAEDSYAGFQHVAVAPLVQIDQRVWMQELFHGPTIAFKDYALQLLGRLFDTLLARRGRRATIVGATSGDTGSAAIEACRDREALDIFILFPKGRVSDVQRRQMTTVASANVHTLAIDGSFDDCQDMVKAMFNDAAFRDEMALSAVNSINWARVMAQIVYYAAAALALGAPDRRLGFVVPTGNFGNVFAGYGARAMGLPIDRLVVATNRNDILHRFFETGAMTAEAVVPTLSPSMDIQISSNFERLLFDLLGRDGTAVRRALESFRQSGSFAVPDPALAEARALFASFRLDDDGTLAEIASLHKATGHLVDPHTAIGLAAARRLAADPALPLVSLATAHAAKFPDAVERATGVRPPLPAHLADLLERPERSTDLANDVAAVKAHIRAHARALEAA